MATSNAQAPSQLGSGMDEDAIPFNIQDYLTKHQVSYDEHYIFFVLIIKDVLSLQIDSTVNRIVNRVIKERPSDPLSSIA